MRDGIELRTNDEPRIDVKLEIGNVNESVEVQADTPLLETETVVSGGVLGGNIVVQIPVLQKLTFRILPYLPDTQVINGLHLNGQRERAMGYNLDGLGAKEPVTGSGGHHQSRGDVEHRCHFGGEGVCHRDAGRVRAHRGRRLLRWSSAAERISSTAAWRIAI